MTDNLLASYLAGVMDSDGFFTIKKSTYHKRVLKDAHNPTYSESVGLKQVCPLVPTLMRDTFGGSLYEDGPYTPNSKPLLVFRATDLIAAEVCNILLPYLRIKKRQAEILLELRESKKPGYKQLAYWFKKEYPNWQDMELITTTQALKMLGHTHPGSISQAIKNKSLLSLPYDYTGKEQPRIPKLLVEWTQELLGRDGRAHNMPVQLLEWREALYQCVIELNKIGINGTPVYFKTGVFKPLE